MNGYRHSKKPPVFLEIGLFGEGADTVHNVLVVSFVVYFIMDKIVTLLY